LDHFEPGNGLQACLENMDKSHAENSRLSFMSERSSVGHDVNPGVLYGTLPFRQFTSGPLLQSLATDCSFGFGFNVSQAFSAGAA
jgi:hypothetical protein